jgi:hypothetical protein
MGFYGIIKKVILLMSDMKFYYQNLKIKPVSIQDGVSALDGEQACKTVGAGWWRISGVYHLFGRRHSNKEQNVETTMYPQHSANLIDLITPNQISPQRMQPARSRHFLRQGLLAVFLGVLCDVPVMAAPIQLPAIVEPALRASRRQAYIC